MSFAILVMQMSATGAVQTVSRRGTYVQLSLVRCVLCDLGRCLVRIRNE